MPETLNRNYYYGNEADQYSFYRIPKILLTDRRYKGVSLEAKVPYGPLLDRMGLSARNGWLDDNGRVFLYFTQEEAMAMLDCSKDKATKLFRELEGIGLMERKKQGQGHPARIYVKNFILEPEPATPFQTAENQQSKLPFMEGAEITPDVSRTLDSSKVSDHHAIIPTMELAKTDPAALPESERNILTLAGARLIFATAEPHIFEAVTAVFSCAGTEFTARGKTVLCRFQSKYPVKDLALILSTEKGLCFRGWSKKSSNIFCFQIVIYGIHNIFIFFSI